MKTFYLLISLSLSLLPVYGQNNTSKSTTLTCNNWLYIPSQPGYVNVGQLNVIGNQITVEAVFNRTTSYTGGFLYAGDLVSKHTGPNDVNYLLRPNSAEITTVNGTYYVTAAGCDIELNKTYHVAMTYDGITLKFYRNGFLMSQVAASGNLFQNAWNTRIGFFQAQTVNTNFIGYINEVRIWNVARSQAQIQANMNGSLPSPTTQSGLLGYYTFDDLLNKQGTAAWNGSLSGSATINAINTSCALTADSCKVATPISNIINTYTPVLALNPCNNKVTVEDASTFNVGDTVMIIQMKGAVIDSTSTAAFGNITNYKNAGNYEFNYVKSKTGNIIELKNVLNRQYDIPTGKIQLIRVPYYDNVTVASTLTCLPWDGNKGGVLVLNVKDTITLNADIDVSGKGFKGGSGLHGNPALFNCDQNQYYYPPNTDFAAGKGEGIALISTAKSYGKGRLANAGGGGDSHNSGGGGGSNISAGGFGGYQYEYSPCDVTVPFDNRGVGGVPLDYTSNYKIFLGGGGGAGHANNPELFYPNGGNGGGICIIMGKVLQQLNVSGKIRANGDGAIECAGYGATGCHEGMGGGGAGGTILLNVDVVSATFSTTISARGGKGADMVQANSFRVAPGGGGGGGLVWFKTVQPLYTALDLAAGACGVCTGYGNDPWGATAGVSGQLDENLIIPIDNVPFKPNIDSVRIKDSLTSCKTYDFKGLVYFNTTGISSWQWNFGDAVTATGQNTTHTYATVGTYNVKLVATDINGCKDSIIKPIVVANCLNPISNIINTYTPVIAFNPCDNKITVEDGSTFNIGDTVLIIQMKGAIIDSTNTAAFGIITDYKNAGNYEFNYVKSRVGNIVELKDTLLRKYDIPVGKVQLIRVPYYYSASVTSTLTCLPWDGKKGGVVVFNVRDTLDMYADINTTGKGFLKGTMHNSNINTFTCDINNYYYPDNTVDAAGKGEGISFLSNNRNSGKGPAANGGGGGMNANTGGGGGSNGNAGGHGGREFNGCANYLITQNWGLAGNPVNYNTSLNKIFMGGAGGAGHCNNQFSNPTTPADFNGGNGGGLIIINSNYIRSTNAKIISKGDSAFELNLPNSFVSHDGMGGGGAGGTVLLNNNNYINILNVDVSGGRGGNMLSSPTGGLVGPGGGGGGGVVWVKQNIIPAALNITNAGGIGGVIIQNGNDPYGATAGLPGINVVSLPPSPLDTIPFVKNIDSVKIKDSLTSCRTYDFKGLAYTSRYPITTWQWNFGDATTAATQNTSHVYAAPGNYSVKLVVTDVNGCKDSILKPVTVAECLNSISNIINTYTPVTAFNPCDNKIIVEDATTFNIGDTVMIIQMKGAVIDSNNTAAFGTITDYKNAGNYEYNYVKSKAGNVVELKDTLLRKYDIPVGKVQLIRVPYYNSVTVTSTLTCLPWDGSKGGVLVFNVKDTVEMLADINTTGRGFLKGTMHNSNINTYTCDIGNYYYPDNTVDAAGKGEGISFLSANRNSGKGAAANGGGGGMNANSGGGGGSNGNIGGRGGDEFNQCPNHLTIQNWGLPGKNIPYSPAVNKIFMGGAGGAGHCNNQFSNPSTPADFNGGNGGALIIINSNYIKNNNYKIISKGDSAFELNLPNSFVSHDGMGGGGAGGTVLLNNNNYINSLSIDVSGGRGANMLSSPTGGLVGPGGGGGGGVVWMKQNAIPAALNITNAGGTGGVIIQFSNSPYGATAGLPGINVFSLPPSPLDTIPFVKNIDSVRIKDSAVSCSKFDFKGLGFTKNSPIVSWDWSFGDLTTANTQNTSHTYTSSGTYTVKLVGTDINGCKDSVVKTVTTSAVNFDFTYNLNACSPTTVQFNAEGTTVSNPYWVINNQVISGNSSPLYTFPSLGNYVVKYSVSNGSCSDTLTKNISLSVIQENIVLTPDTTICYGDSKLLRTVPTLNYCWTPSSFLNDPLLANPTTSTKQPITYYFTALATGTNLVNNGSFDAGNAGFTSQYNFANPNVTEGQYFVGSSPQAWNIGLSNCPDHTGISGNGNMLLVNGAPAVDVKVWSQSIAVTPNTNYAFSAWVEALFTPNPAQLKFSINGVNVGLTISAVLPTCTWKQFYTTWNSGNNTTADLSIVNKNTAVQGNDFAMDDISFAPVQFKRDSIKISIDSPVVKTIADLAVCENVPVQITTTGAAGYSWSPVTGLSNPSIGNPIATATISTQYIVKGTTVNGCSANDTLNISISPKPVITKTNDTAVCVNGSVQLNASGGTNYAWTPAGTLTNPNSSNPVASPVTATTYIVTVTGANTCINKDSVKVAIKPLPVFAVNPSDAVCLNNQKQLAASGGNSYLWSPAAMVSNPNISNPLTNISSTQTFTVTIKETVCNQSATLTTLITVLPTPFINAGKTNDITCSLGSAMLTATGGSQYVWTPATGLSNPNIGNPVASPTMTTLYTVTGTDAFGCTNNTTISVAVNYTGKANYYMPNSFTPNGDGLNDCYRIKYFGQITDLNFIIYNRWGEKVFSTSNPDGCWDGTYKGQPVEPGNYVYYIKAITACGPLERKGNLILIR